MKTYLASDFHLGSEDSEYLSILKFLDLAQRKADELILLGDILDLWRNNYKNITTREPYKTAYEFLLETSMIVPITVVPGNHDYNIGKYLKNTNITVKNRFKRDGISYLHGWELDCTQLAAFPYFDEILTYFPSIYQTYFYNPPQTKLYGYSQIDLIRDIARMYVKKNHLQYIIHGHTHRDYTDGVIFDCGCYGESYVVVEDGKPELRRL